jgi:hypothetical protein
MKPAKSESTPSQRLAEILASECPDEAIGQVLRDCLGATIVTRSGAVQADSKTRLECARLVLGYRHGLAVKREEVVTVNLGAEESDKLAERLAKSPALRKALSQMLSAHPEAKAIDV